MNGDDEVRCDRCGEKVSYDGKNIVCVGCDHRVDRRGRKTRTQPTKAERARRKLAAPRLFGDDPPRGPIFTPRYIANIDDPPPTRFTAHRKKPTRPRCVPCDRWLVWRNRYLICCMCGEIHQRPQALTG